VTVLGYHRFEDPAKDSLAISPADFRKQLEALREAEIAVISMDDFLAWRRGEKEIPEKSAVITIDDGYNCTYHVAWPILQEFDYPFTVYPYTEYISAGGRSITWEQLAEMRDAGVDIGNHSRSHDNLVRPRRAGGADYQEWLEEELKGSKDRLEEKLGITVTTFAYPYGVYNEAIAAKGLEAGYEALFTVAGRKISRDTPSGTIGRYVIQSDKPETFRAAIQFGDSRLPAGGTALGGPSVPVSPSHRETIGEEMPMIRAELGGLGAIDPKSVEMRVGGLGQVPVEFDAETGVLTYQMRSRVYEPGLTVVLRARADGKRVETGWEFFVDPAALQPDEATLAPPSDTELDTKPD